jgi:hypothetical protein
MPGLSWIFRERCGTLVQTSASAKGNSAMQCTKRRIGAHLGLAALAYLLFSLTPGGRALAVENPSDWVKGIYQTYAANKTVPSSLSILKPEASPRLKRLIEAEEACMKRGKGICRLDFDPIVNAQDFSVTDIQVRSHAIVGSSSPSKGIVTATFKNGGEVTIIEYTFTRQGARWLLDDVAAKTPGQETWTLSNILGARRP